MEYCCHIWAGAPSCYLELLDKLQKRNPPSRLLFKISRKYALASSLISQKSLTVNTLMKMQNMYKLKQKQNNYLHGCLPN